MYCPQCGQMNEDSVRFCSMCGRDLEEVRAQWRSGSSGAGTQAGQGAGAGYQSSYDQQYYQQPYGAPPYGGQQYQQTYQSPQYQRHPGTMPHVPSYLGWAIAVLILCFWPTGIAAVVFASQVGTKLAVGDYHGAVESSRKAKTWSWITFGIGISGIVIAIIASTTLWFY
jgi:hypothetical protein